MAGGARGLLRVLPLNLGCQTSAKFGAEHTESPPKGPVEDIYATAQGLPVVTLPEWHMKTVPAMLSLPDTLWAMIGRVIFSVNRWSGFLGARP
jgi:hypothetical protein